MAKIRITPENLEAQAKQLRTYKDEHVSAYGKMRTLVANLINEWEGEAQSAFRASFEGRAAQFQQFEKDVEGFATLMDTAAKEMRQTEEALRSRMSQGV